MCDNMSVSNKQAKLEILERIEADTISTTESLSILESYANDEDSYIRSVAAKILIDFADMEQGERLLRILINDSDYLVRTEAADSLSCSNSMEVVDLLKKHAKTDKTGMVRGYAIVSLGDIAQRLGIQKDISEFLTPLIHKETVIFTQINLAEALYRLNNDEKHLKKLLAYLDTRIYQNRCAVINSLSPLIGEHNKALIVGAVVLRKKVESVYAVLSAIDEFLLLHG
ncbi:MAG: HEAT repeat domain-containing protein [Defluviitaleaceae bacterium]|nr:HEAT repeat domain-containing protein [Defluviitaleaceae bacterium]